MTTNCHKTGKLAATEEGTFSLLRGTNRKNRPRETGEFGGGGVEGPYWKASFSQGGERGGHEVSERAEQRGEGGAFGMQLGMK